MSKPVKELVRKELISRLGGTDSLAIVGFSGVDAVSNNAIRSRLADKRIRLTVVKNALARQAFKEMGLDGAETLLEGPCAVAYGGESVVNVVRELLDIRKNTPAMTVKGALMEGTVFPADQIDALSKYPTRGEAISRLVSCILSPAGKIAACLKSPAGRIASILKTIEEKAKEVPAQEAPAAA